MLAASPELCIAVHAGRVCSSGRRIVVEEFFAGFFNENQ